MLQDIKIKCYNFFGDYSLGVTGMDEAMKKRGLINRKPISTNIQLDLWHALDGLAKKLKRNKSGLFDEAIVLLLQAYKEPLTDSQKAIIAHLINDN